MTNLIQIKSTILQRAINSEYDVNIKRYTKAVDWLFAPENKDIVVKSLQEHQQIDFPDYFGMPKQISHKLSGDEVDLLQEFVPTTLTTYYHADLLNNKKINKKTP